MLVFRYENSPRRRRQKLAENSLDSDIMTQKTKIYCPRQQQWSDDEWLLKWTSAMAMIVTIFVGGRRPYTHSISQNGGFIWRT